MSTHKQQFNKRHGFERDASHTLYELSKISGYPVSTLNEIYERGRGAWVTNIDSVRMKGTFKKNVKAPRSKKLSAEQWGVARIYAFLNKIEKGAKLDHDTDLF